MGQIEQNLPHCTACQNTLENEQNYCSNCGQKIGKKKISVLSIFTDTFGNYLSFERSGLSTIYHIFTRPNFIVENYCNGNKGYYASPGKMIIFSVVLIALQITFVSKQILGTDFEITGLTREYSFFLLNFVLFVIVSQLTFIRHGFKLARHVVSVTYTMTAILIAFLLFDNFCLLVGISSSSYLLLIYMEVVLLLNSFALSRKRVWWMYVLNFIFENFILITILFLLEILINNLQSTP